MAPLDSAHPSDRSDVPGGDDGIDLHALQDALARVVSGEVRFDAQARALYATDSSNYREVPLGVVLPRSLDDVVQAVAVCRRFGAPVTGRGAGTSLAGQCCNVAVVIDFSKHLNRVLELDPDARTAWVEPGCVLDDLRDAARAHGLTFGPDPSTHDHCTLGGMVGNDSCGVHSVLAGRTADNVEALEILTYDGERMVVGATDDAELERTVAAGDRRGEIYGRLRALRDRYADEIRARFPDIPRRVSGFNLDELLPEKGFHVARALVGSEGTCVTVLRIKCRLVPDPAARAVLVLGYPDVYSAADAVPRVLEAGPIGLEGIDERLVEFMQRKHMRESALEMLPEGGGWLFVEFGGATREEAEAAARRLRDDLADGDVPSTALVAETEEQERLWKVREAGLPATTHIPDMPSTHPGWEDSAVPPDQAGAYLRAFRKLVDEFGYDCSIYGHFGDGCIHCRIDFDLATEPGVARYLAFVDRAADLVVAHGGSLSGEHGDGQARAALLGKMFGPELVGAFRAFKEAWDPGWRMNPGKVVAPDAIDAHLRHGPDYRPWAPGSRLKLRADGHDFAGAAERCVGVGKCRKHDSGVMCPSYMATREEAYSTRGRAHLLFEMTRGEVIRDGWRSDAVHDALDLCLACKACKSECPVNVDMASYKAEFMYHHYRGRLRPRAHYAMGLIWWWGQLGSRAPRLVNAVARTRPFSDVAKWAGGFAPEREIPAFAAPSFRDWFACHRPARSDGASRGRVVLWPDTFNTYFTADPLKATVSLLERAGWEVEIPARPVCCGRPLYAAGFLGLADRMWGRTLDALRPHIGTGTPIVGLEPTCVAAFRDELLEMRPDDRDARRLAGQVRHLSELLEEAEYEPPRLEGRALLQPHCHHRAVLGTEAEASLLRRAGVDLEMLDAGCCGMAGDYGFRKETYPVAMQAGERAYLPRLREAGDAWVVADGFSCREQARQATGRTPLTLPELLLQGRAA